MPLNCDYDVYFFDCDGVILDSNQLKIAAMEAAISSLSCISNDDVQRCKNYFSKNFGLSRYHHVRYFLSEILNVGDREKGECHDKILSEYSQSCLKLYLEANLTEGVLELLEKIKKPKYIVSGSDESELREVFLRRGLSKYFVGVYGSPEKKINIITSIMKDKYNSALMIGDAQSDYLASKGANIDFIYYKPYSCVKKEMIKLSRQEGFPILNDFEDFFTGGSYYEV